MGRKAGLCALFRPVWDEIACKTFNHYLYIVPTAQGISRDTTLLLNLNRLFEMVFNFEGEMMQGNIKSANALRLIKEWAVLRKPELEENWKNISEKIGINKIEPLH